MNEVAKTKLDLRILQARKDEDGQVIKDYQEWQTKQYQTRYALHFYTRLPLALQKEIDREDLVRDVESTQGSINELQEDINYRKEELRQEKLSAIESESNAKKQSVEQIISGKKQEQTDAKMQIAELVTSDDPDAIDKIKPLKWRVQELTKEIDVLEKERDATFTKIDSEISGVQVFIDKQVEEEFKEQLAEIKKFTKELTVAKEKLAKIDDVPIFVIESEEGIKARKEFELTDINQGNYFVKGEKGGIIYKDKDMDLSHIDWINCATVFDIIEGLERIAGVSGAYLKTNSTLRAPFENYYQFNGSSKVNLTQIQKDHKIFTDEDFAKFYPEFDNAIGSYWRTESLVNIITRSVSKNPIYSHYYIWDINFSRRRIVRSIINYHSTVENQEPEQYLANLEEKIRELTEKTGGGSITKIPDDVIEKYIDKAVIEIQKRNTVYSNYTSLVDSYATLNELMNIESPYVKFESSSTGKGLAALEISGKGTIEGAEITATLLHGKQEEVEITDDVEID
jgi:hypothetical protein